MMGDLRLKSFNCCGVANKIPVINELCDGSDIVLLQETWLLPSDVKMLDNAHYGFHAFFVSAVDMGVPLKGRVSCLWRKDLGISIKIE